MPHAPEVLSFVEFAQRYCERQVETPAKLRVRLKEQLRKFSCDGWMLLECQMLDGSRLGELTILPYGPNNSFKEPPTHPISPRGLASDMSVVVALLPFHALNE